MKETELLDSKVTRNVHFTQDSEQQFNDQIDSVDGDQPENSDYYSQSSTANNNSNPNSLLSGEYDESQASASFQDALLQWRNAKKSSSSGKNESDIKNSVVESHVNEDPKVIHKSASKTQSVQPAKLTSTNASQSGMTNPPNIPEIKLKNTGLSFTQRLLLEKLRNNQKSQFNH